MKTGFALALTIASALAAAGVTPAQAEPPGGDNTRQQRYFGWHGPRHDGFERVCAADFQSHVETLLGYVRNSLAINSGQEAPWEDFARAVRVGTTTFTEACANADAGENSAAERLAHAETVMEAGLAAIQHVRPAFAALYATLDDTQRRRVDDLMTRRRR